MYQSTFLNWLFRKLFIQLIRGDIILPALYFTWIEINFKNSLLKTKKSVLKKFVTYLVEYHVIQKKHSLLMKLGERDERKRERLKSAFRIDSICPQEFVCTDTTILIADDEAVLDFIKSDDQAITAFEDIKFAFGFRGYCEIVFNGENLYIIKPISHNKYTPGRFWKQLVKTIHPLVWTNNNSMTFIIDSPLEDVTNYFFLILLIQYKFSVIKISSLLYFSREGVVERLHNRIDLTDFNKRYGIVDYVNDPFLPYEWINKRTSFHEKFLAHKGEDQKSLPSKGRSFVCVIKERISSFTSKFTLNEKLHTSDRDLNSVEKAFISSCRFEDKNHIHPLRILLKSIDSPDTPILLLGETGVGKTFIGKNLHKHCDRKDKVFKHLNCSAIPSTLIESELFGAVYGAFSGVPKGGIKGKIEDADGGVLFLDEITEAHPDIQSKILTFLDDGTFYKMGKVEPLKSDVRMIFAFNRDPLAAIKEGKLRHDLYFRISAVSFTVPSLKNRPKELEEIISDIFKEIAAQHKLPNLKLPKDSLDYLKKLSWPGNIRQLRNQMKVSIIDCAVRECDLLSIDILKSHYNSVGASAKLIQLETVLEELFLEWEKIKPELLKDNEFAEHFKNREGGPNFIDGFLKPVLANMFKKKFEKTYNRKDVGKVIGMHWQSGDDSYLVEKSNIYPIIEKYFKD